MTNLFSKNKLRAILWDIDGTLFSAEGLLLPTYQQAFGDFAKQLGPRLKVPTTEEIMPQIGRPVSEIFINLAPDLTPRERNALSLQVLAELVKQITWGEGHYYEGMVEVLGELHERGHLFFSASNGRYPYVEAILRSSQTFPYFQAITSLNNTSIKTKNALVQSILRDNNLMPDEVLLVGDRYTDRDAAVNNNVAFIATAYGHGHATEWEGAVGIVDSLKELKELIE